MTYSIVRGTAEAGDLGPPGGKWEGKHIAYTDRRLPQHTSALITLNPDTDTDDETFTVTLTIDDRGLDVGRFELGGGHDRRRRQGRSPR